MDPAASFFFRLILQAPELANVSKIVLNYLWTVRELTCGIGMMKMAVSNVILILANEYVWALIYTLFSMQSIPAFPYEADVRTIEAGGEGTCSTEQCDYDHESSALPLECFASENPEIEQND